MREFNSLASFAAFAGTLVAEVEHAKHTSLETAAKIVETEAKRVLGTYEYGWPPLKPATIEQKTTGDSPLLETGEMRDSIGHMVQGNEAWVGSDNDKAVWQELGTPTIPPRSFLAGAAIHKEDDIRRLFGSAVVGKLAQTKTP